MVNVTKRNFLEQSNDLISNLPQAAFVAIDEEMTGISIPNIPRPPKDDTPVERYKTLKQIPERYSIIQFGVALFIPNNSRDNSFNVKRYNFYLFPNSSSNVKEVTLNPSSIEFLQEHGMNFNLWTKEGIPYCTSSKAIEFMEKYRKRAFSLLTDVDSKPKPFSRKKVELTRPEDINFHARSMASLREWIDSARASTNDEGTSFILPPANAFLRRALYESIGQEYPSLILEKCNSSQIRVLRLTVDEKNFRRERQRKEAFEHLMVQELGFWRIFYALSQANRGMLKKGNSIALAANMDEVNLEECQQQESLNSSHRKIPIVLHNGLMDILFALTHFHHPVLPEKYQECKTLICDNFPLLYDTKVMTTEGPRSMRHDNTVLNQLFMVVVTATVASSLHLINSDETQIHEASYDAYMTGAVFYGLVMGVISSLTNGDTITYPWNFKSPNALLTTCTDDAKILRKCFACNKLYLMLTMYTIDLLQEEDPLSRGMHINTTFCVSGSDASISTRDIVQCLASLTAAPTAEGGGLHFEIIWVNDTTFFVAAREDEEERNLERLQHHGKLIHEALCARFTTSKIVCLRDYNQQRKQMNYEETDSKSIEEPTKKRKSLWKIWTWFGEKSEEDTSPSAKRPRIA
mmetsp:Transcript_7786/g.8922  ORF Transcript_7786/g.8922 Transcript_7786/m.8922 type:complete len:634 (+) Transcript_7786:342-2243(+)|eukprot:CAMPEP_0194156520 /NCGR_PEP_ID=MMETSP0152-20130528/68635_1 /TAXON_ID=1049557 /ORGANISM="Thalassiothrix antarctica, Strain L6-D1" /LENGTH=633 /DNA_ID=CAMNT_0038864241 /DNA_START=185 /DNA_END=2086 /DNA_ORIENTATION=+